MATSNWSCQQTPVSFSYSRRSTAYRWCATPRSGLISKAPGTAPKNRRRPCGTGKNSEAGISEVRQARGLPAGSQQPDPDRTSNVVAIPAGIRQRRRRTCRRARRPSPDTACRMDAAGSCDALQIIHGLFPAVRFWRPPPQEALQGATPPAASLPGPCVPGCVVSIAEPADLRSREIPNGSSPDRRA